MKFKTVIRCVVQIIVITVIVANQSTTNAPPFTSPRPFALNVVDFNFLVDRMAMLARVLTGISLQNGLADGSISEDEVIPELLNISSVTLDDVENFNKEKVDKYISNLNGIRNMESGSSNLEEDICFMKRVEELWSKADGFLEADRKIFDELEEWKAFDFGILTEHLEPILYHVSNFSNWPNDYSTNDISSNLVESYLNDTWTSLRPLDDAIALLASIKSRKMLLPWNKLESVPSRLELFRCFSEAISIADHYSQLNNRTLDKKEKEAFMQNIKRVENITFDYGTHFKVMDALSSRFLPQLNQQFPGFANGYHDLKHIIEDSSSLSVLKSLNMTIPIRTVSQTFSPFVEKVSLLGDSWSSVSNRSLHRSIARVIQLQEPFKKFYGFSERYQKSIQAIEKCMKMSERSQSSWYVISRYIPKMKSKFEALVAVLKFLTDSQVQNFKALMTTINTAPNGESTRETVTASVDKLKQFSGTDDVIDFVENILPLLKPFHKASRLQSIISIVQAGIYFLSTLNETELVLKRIEYFKCLSSIRTEIQNYSDISEFFDTLRVFNVGQADRHIQTGSDRIADSLLVVKSFRSVLEKGEDKPMINEMNMLQWNNLTNTTKSFGRAVAGVVAVQKAMNNIFSFEILLSGLKAVDEDIAAITNMGARERAQKAWGDTEETRSAIQKLIDQLKSKAKDAARIREGTNLKLTDYQEFFTSLSGIDDVDLDIDRKLDAIDYLVVAVPTSKNRIEFVQKTLTEIGSLDLKFSKYTEDLLRTTHNLATIQNAFEPTIKATKAIKTVPTGSPVQHNFTLESNTDYEWVPTFIYTMFSIILVGILGVITLMIYREHLIRKYEEEEEREEKQREKMRNDRVPEAREEVNMGRHLLGDLMGLNEAAVSDLEKSAEPKKSIELKDEATQRSDQEELKPVKMVEKKEMKPSNVGVQHGATSRPPNPTVAPTPPPNRGQSMKVGGIPKSEQVMPMPPKKKGGMGKLDPKKFPSSFPNPILTPTRTPHPSQQTSATPVTLSSTSHRP